MIFKYSAIFSRFSEILNTRGEAIRAVKSALDRAGVVMPEPACKVGLFDTAWSGADSDAGARARRSMDVRDVTDSGESVAIGDVAVDRTINEKAISEDLEKGNMMSSDSAREY